MQLFHLENGGENYSISTDNKHPREFKPLGKLKQEIFFVIKKRARIENFYFYFFMNSNWIKIACTKIVAGSEHKKL
jgi:hypothetical protein